MLKVQYFKNPKISHHLYDIFLVAYGITFSLWRVSWNLCAHDVEMDMDFPFEWTKLIVQWNGSNMLNSNILGIEILWDTSTQWCPLIITRHLMTYMIVLEPGICHGFEILSMWGSLANGWIAWGIEKHRRGYLNLEGEWLHKEGVIRWPKGLRSREGKAKN